MKLSSTVSQNVRIFVTAAVITAGALGCGGSNDNNTGGTAGTSGGGAAGTGAGGTGSGAAGTSGAACTLAQVNKILVTTTTNVGCTVSMACHDAAGTAAGLDLESSTWQTKLVGKSPSATAGVSPNMSKCANMNLVYLKAGSNPASGLFIDKINPATDPAMGATVAICGSHMPNLGTDLSASDFACIQSYLTTLTK